jgi:predicted metal-dependent peptidase
MSDSQWQALGVSKETLDNELSKTKTKMFFSDAVEKKNIIYLAHIMSMTDFKWDFEQETAYTTGTVIGFNPKFFHELSVEGRILVLVHELWHIGLNHVERMLIFDDFDRANEAADHVINLLMQSAGFDFNIIPFPVHRDLKFKDKSLEEIYHLLEPKYKIPAGGGASNSPSGSGQVKPNPLANDVKKLPTNSDKKLDAETSQKLNNILVQAYQASKMANHAGNLPGEITELIDNFLNPILPWEQLLENYFNEVCKDEYSRKRPSRRHDTEYISSLFSNERLSNLNYYIDVSGSITSEQVHRFNSELKGIKDQFNPEKLNVIQFDTKIRKIDVLAEGQNFREMEIKGRGGTSLVCVRNHILKTNPDVSIIFSDLYVPPMDKIPGANVLWICIDNPNAKVEFGRLIHLSI